MSTALLFCLLSFRLSQATDKPLIGILSLPCSDEPYQCTNNPKATSYFGASYVKWLESGGARVIPLIADDSFENINKILPKLNGVLITGGAAGDTSSSFWWNQLNNLLNGLRKFRDSKSSKEAIPLWATCLGFEGIQESIAGTTAVKVSRKSDDASLPLDFTSNAAKSRIFDNLMMNDEYSSMVFNILQSENVTYNHHSFGISPDSYNGSYPFLSTNFSILATNKDEFGNLFVSLIESLDNTKLFWYGSQFHPEKAEFIFDADNGNNHIAHSMNAIIANQYFAEFFVNECRIRNNNIMDEKMYNDNVIYNDKPHFVENGTQTYEQVYLFEKP